VRLDAEVGTLVWPNDADFAPATLHDWQTVSAGLIARPSHGAMQPTRGTPSTWSRHALKDDGARHIVSLDVEAHLEGHVVEPSSSYQAAYGAERSRQFLERIEDLQPRTPEVTFISGGDRQSIATSRRCDVAILDRHALAQSVEQALLLRPDVGNRYVEAMNTAAECVAEPSEPHL